MKLGPAYIRRQRLKRLRYDVTRNANLARRWMTDAKLYPFIGWSDIQPKVARDYARAAAHAANELQRELDALNEAQS